MTLNVGIVGCGLISEAHIKAWQKTPGFTVRGVIDTNAEQAQKRAGQFKIDTIFNRLDQLIEACDVVDVCRPPQSHAAIAQQAVAGGRHLVMEKPVVTDVADWDKLAKSVNEAKTKLAVIHNAKFLRSIQQAKRWVDDGRIGDVIRVHREFLTHASTDRMLVGEGHWSHKLPGGRWFETLPHELYLTHWFAGPLDGGWRATDITASAELVYAPCGVTRSLNINTELRVDSGSSTAKSYISMRTSDGEVYTIVNFQWKQC